MWNPRTTPRCANLHGERVIEMLRMALYQLWLAFPLLTLSQICSLLLRVLPTKGLTPAAHTRKSTPPQLSRTCRGGGDMGGREVLLPWDTILVGLGIYLDSVLKRNNPKQDWRMAGSLFRSQTSGRSWVSAQMASVLPDWAPQPAISSTHLSWNTLVSSPFSWTL